MESIIAEEIKTNDNRKIVNKGVKSNTGYNPVDYANKGLAYDPNSIHNIMIQHLLQPKNYINLPENAPFRFSSEHII